MNSAVIKFGEHVSSEKLKNIPGAIMLTAGISVSSAVVLYEHRSKKRSYFLTIEGACETFVSVLK